MTTREQSTSRSGLTLAVVEDLLGKGWSQSEIAREYGVTRQYVSWIRRHYNGRLNPKEEVRQHFPWKVPAAMGQTAPYRNLRYHAEFFVTGGIGMSDVQLQRLRSFYKKLRDEDLVVEFDPNIPPEPGVSSQGGWAYRKRRKSDGDLLIRVNDYANLTDQGRRIWRFPQVEP